jgi:hypothetical protein
MLERIGIISRDAEEVTKKHRVFGPEIRADNSQNKWQVQICRLNPIEDRVYVCVCVDR